MLFMEASRNIKLDDKTILAGKKKKKNFIPFNPKREKKKWIKGDLEKSQPRARAFFYAYFKPFFYV